MNKLQKTLIAVSIAFVALIIGTFLLKTQKGKVAGVQTSSEETPIRGMTLPHHKLAEKLILESFERLKNENFSYVIILGPNHFEPEINSIVTAKNIPGYSFETEVMDAILQKFPDIVTSNELINKEHSITLHLPYIKNYMPNAKIVPLMISPYAGKNDLFEKVNYLTSIIPSDTLLIASVDFAHDVMQDTALKNNEESIAAISSFNYQKISGYEDEHMDSPLSISMLLKSMQNLGATKWETWYSTHAAILEGDPAIQGTSYVIGVFR